jgi:hypothetical protein
MDDNTQSWFDFAQRPFEQGGLGLAKHQAAGIVGNLIQESGSGLKPWGPTGDNNTAWGTAQWRGDRLSGLQDFAAANGMDPRSVQAQQAWMRQELTSTHAPAYDALRAAKTPEDAATAFNRRYEISADRSGQREANAAALASGNPIAAINSAAGIKQGGGRPALAFSGDDDEDTPANAAPTSGALTPGAGALAFSGGGTGKKDNRFGLGDLFGASDETKDKLHGIGARLVRAAAAASAGVNPAQAAQFNALGKSLEEQNKPDIQYMMGPNGQVIKINKDDGSVNFATLPGGGKGSYHPVMGKDDNGNPIYRGRVNLSTNTFEPVAGGGTMAQEDTPIGGDPNLTGQERYDSLSTQEKAQMDAWKNGTGIQPSQYAMRNPKVSKLVDAANAIGIDMTKYGERQAFFKGMASKSPTAAGGQFVMAPTVLKHLDNLTNDYLGLGNSNGGPLGYGTTAANAYKNAVGGNPRASQQTSADRNSDTAGKEITSFLTRGHGGVSERQEAHEKLYQPNAAPMVQAAALEAYRKQVADRFYELLDGSKGTVGDHPELARVEAEFKAKDEALQQKIADLKAGKFPGAAPAAAAKPAAAIHSSWDEAQKAGWK